MTTIDWDEIEAEQIEIYLEREEGKIRADACCAVGDKLRTKEWDSISSSMLAKLHERLADVGPPVRFEAAIALAELGDERATSVLLSALSTKRLRLDAMRALGRGGNKVAKAALQNWLGRFWAPWADRLQAAAALSALGDDVGHQYLVQKSSAKRFAERAAALHFLAENQAPEALGLLNSIANDSNDGHRESALASLALLGEPEVATILMKHQKDSDAEVSSLAKTLFEEWTERFSMRP